MFNNIPASDSILLLDYILQVNFGAFQSVDKDLPLIIGFADAVPVVIAQNFLAWALMLSGRPDFRP